MARRIVLTVLLVLLLTNVVYAMGGHVAVDYDTMNEDWVWEVEVFKDLGSFVKVGFNMATYSPVFGFKHFIPSWAPFRLDYQVYAEVKYKSVSLRVTDWCDHWFAQSGKDAWESDSHGLTLRLKYEF